MCNQGLASSVHGSPDSIWCIATQAKDLNELKYIRIFSMLIKVRERSHLTFSGYLFGLGEYGQDENNYSDETRQIKLEKSRPERLWQTFEQKR